MPYERRGGHKARPYREIFGIGGSAGPFFAAFEKIVEKLRKLLEQPFENGKMTLVFVIFFEISIDFL